MASEEAALISNHVSQRRIGSRSDNVWMDREASCWLIAHRRIDAYTG